MTQQLIQVAVLLQKKEVMATLTKKCIVYFKNI